MIYRKTECKAVFSVSKLGISMAFFSTSTNREHAGKTLSINFFRITSSMVLERQKQVICDNLSLSFDCWPVSILGKQYKQLLFLYTLVSKFTCKLKFTYQRFDHDGIMGFFLYTTKACSHLVAYLE